MKRLLMLAALFLTGLLSSALAEEPGTPAVAEEPGTPAVAEEPGTPAVAEEPGTRSEKRDADGDGKISKEEFMSWAEKRGVEEKKAAKRFRRNDADGDGFISIEELQERKQKRESEMAE